MSQIDESILVAGKKCSHIYGWLVCGLAAVFYAYEYLLRIAPSVMTTDLMKTFGIGAGKLSFLIALYYYAYTPAQFVVGVLLDRFGPKKILTLACFICVLGTWIFANTDSTLMFGFARFLMGLGSAFAFCGVLKLATIWLPPHRFAMVAGLNSALGTIGAMFGVIIMSEFVQTYGWRETSHAGMLIGAVLVVILYLLLKDAPSGIRYDAQKIKTREILRSMKNILLNPQMWVCGLVGCLLYLPTSAFAELWAIPYFQATLGYSEREAAIVVFSIFCGFTVGAPISGFLSDHLRVRCKPLFLGSLCAAATVLIILYFPNLSPRIVDLLAFLFGLLYSVQVIVFAVGKEISPRNAAGTAIAVTNGLVMIGGNVFQPLIGILLDYFWDGQIQEGVRIYSPSDYKMALMVLPLALIAGGILTLFLKETNAKASIEN